MKHKLYIANDEVMRETMDFYCNAKSGLWRMFFGWRKTKGDKMYFRLTRKQYQEILEYAWKMFEYEIL